MEPFKEERVSFSSYIGQKNEGKTLEQFLSGRFTYFSAALWREKIEARDVLVNGEWQAPDTVLGRKDKVEYIAMTRPEPKVPTHIPVLYEDEDLLIVNKPAHIPVHPGGRYLRNTLIHLLQKQRGNQLLVLAHRLDRETSGVCVLSKTTLGKEKMYWQFFKNEVKKTYWALCWGIPKPISGVIDSPIGLASGEGSSVKTKIRIKQAVGGAQPKSARTKYHLLSTRWIEAAGWQPPPWPALRQAQKGQEGSPWPISLVECKPVTGRTNQIRVHLAHIGCGIVGDKLYDPDESIFLEFKDSPALMSGDKSPKMQKLSERLRRRLVLDAHALHAKALEFRHPRSGKVMKIEAPPPKSWRGLFDTP